MVTSTTLLCSTLSAKRIKRNGAIDNVRYAHLAQPSLPSHAVHFYTTLSFSIEFSSAVGD